MKKCKHTNKHTEIETLVWEGKLSQPRRFIVTYCSDCGEKVKEVEVK